MPSKHWPSSPDLPGDFNKDFRTVASWLGTGSSGCLVLLETLPYAKRIEFVQAAPLVMILGLRAKAGETHPQWVRVLVWVSRSLGSQPECFFPSHAV